MITPLQPRVSTPNWALSAASETQNLGTRGVRGGFLVWMLDQDFERQHYAYQLGLEYDGVDHQLGNDIISGMLRELGHYGRERASRLFPQLVYAVARDHLMYGKCMFEFFNDADSDTPGPRLGVLPGWSLKHRCGRHFPSRSESREARMAPTPQHRCDRIPSIGAARERVVPHEKTTASPRRAPARGPCHADRRAVQRVRRQHSPELDVVADLDDLLAQTRPTVLGSDRPGADAASPHVGNERAPFGNILGIRYNPHYLETLATKSQ
jgi:hypothetical protein